MSRSMGKNKFPAMCRLCMDQNILLVNLHPRNGNTKHSPGNILEVIENFTTVKIDPLDSLPQKICESCIQTLNSMLAFRNKCKHTNEELHKMIAMADESENIIEILDGSDSKENSDADEGDEEYQENSDADEGDEEYQENESDDWETVTGQDSEKDQDSDINQGSEKNQRSVKDGDESEVKRSNKIACHICGKLYITHEMKYHMNDHNGLKPFQCNEPNCTSKFAFPHSLSKHKRFCHSLKPLLFCDVCGRGFKVKVGLEMHRSYHFDPNLPCSICEKLFRNKRALRKHMLVHSQERKFKCDTCGKSYQTRYTLRIHKRVHTQEKPYSCHCGAAFAYKCLLKSHTEKQHK